MSKALLDSKIQQAKQNINIVSVIESFGTELRPTGGDRLKGLCPFHPETNPSFYVFKDTQYYYCYGCLEHGDVIDLIRRLRGLSFPEALKALGLDDWRPSSAEMKSIKARQRRQKAAQRRERDLAWTLGKAIRTADSILSDPDNSDWELKALILQHLETLKYQYSIFIEGDAVARTALVHDLKDVSPFPRRLLFTENFDYASWHRQTSRVDDQQEPHNEESSRIKISFG